MFRTVSIAAASALAMVAGLAATNAAVAAEMEKPSFETADENGDGKISFEEAKAQGYDKYQFIAQDVNQDGMLTKEDWRYISRRSNFVLAGVE
ncbi:hypothetical protein [Ferruginivarius sediminum]|nr:hypothetical protein [Ferruginivarius sediminum]